MWPTSKQTKSDALNSSIVTTIGAREHRLTPLDLLLPGGEICCVAVTQHQWLREALHMDEQPVVLFGQLQAADLFQRVLGPGAALIRLAGALVAHQRGSGQTVVGFAPGVKHEQLGLSLAAHRALLAVQRRGALQDVAGHHVEHSVPRIQLVLVELLADHLLHGVDERGAHVRVVLLLHAVDGVALAQRQQLRCETGQVVETLHHDRDDAGQRLAQHHHVSALEVVLHRRIQVEEALVEDLGELARPAALAIEQFGKALLYQPFGALRDVDRFGGSRVVSRATHGEIVLTSKVITWGVSIPRYRMMMYSWQCDLR
mmetsp:Transcript_40023/g.100830  ORF Transcript_40023/g.100830 Transcript_40023/m.100830 type:complete len:315 (-) Transcript_40023:57-1001(-)